MWCKLVSRGVSRPRRTCVGCRRVAGSDELVRVSRCPDGSVGVGRDKPGRGAWLCAGAIECFEAAVPHGFSRALRTRLSEGDLAGLRARLFEDSNMRTE